MPHLETKSINGVNENDIQDLIGRSENQSLEFKCQEIDGFKFAKLISGFANAKGGYIVIGAKEDEHGVCDGFVSVLRPEVINQKIQQFNRDYIDEPVQNIETKGIQLPTGENLLVVHVAESTRKPHAIRRQGDRLLQFWVRRESHNFEMKLNEFRNVVLESAGVLDFLSRSDSETNKVERLSDLEEEILFLALGSQGVLYLMSANEIGNWLRVGSKNFEENQNPTIRIEAIEAFERLQSMGLVRHESGIFYTLTGEGFTVAQELKENHDRG